MKQRIRSIIVKLAHSSVGILFKWLFSIIIAIEYYLLNIYWWLRGKRLPSEEERQLVRENVTFIYKSFERQGMAKRLFHSIQRYYPGAKVVIADDSAQPLTIENSHAEIIHLPFNSGLSYGISCALERVKTPFLVRLDDDEMLTPYSEFGRHLLFLMKHKEVDLASILCFRAPLWAGRKNEAKKYYRQQFDKSRPLKIAHMTHIDDSHTVVAKPPNCFIARTEKIKEVGYDKNIRMIDHNEFFYRAAGVIVSVLDESSFIFHYHNPFDTHYMKYRNDTLGDSIYIRKKHMKR